jgi:hypothetical protein
MNRVLQQRFNQISRQNNFSFASRDKEPARAHPTPAKPPVARPQFPNETHAFTVRRG